MPCDIIRSVVIGLCLENFEEGNEIIRKRRSKDIFFYRLLCIAV